MAYFYSGSDLADAREYYCDRCIHGSGTCPVWELHMDWTYEAAGKDGDETKARALEALWPRNGADNGDCRMFVEVLSVETLPNVRGDDATEAARR